MLTYDAHRVFHVQNQTIRLDLERSRLLAQSNFGPVRPRGPHGGNREAGPGWPVLLPEVLRKRPQRVAEGAVPMIIGDHLSGN